MRRKEVRSLGDTHTAIAWVSRRIHKFEETLKDKGASKRRRRRAERVLPRYKQIRRSFRKAVRKTF